MESFVYNKSTALSSRHYLKWKVFLFFASQTKELETPWLVTWIKVSCFPLIIIFQNCSNYYRYFHEFDNLSFSFSYLVVHLHLIWTHHYFKFIQLQSHFHHFEWQLFCYLLCFVHSRSISEFEFGGLHS